MVLYLFSCKKDIKHSMVLNISLLIGIDRWCKRKGQERALHAKSCVCIKRKKHQRPTPFQGGCSQYIGKIPKLVFILFGPKRRL